MTTIDVTQEDIDGGDSLACKTCPIARAANRATGRRVEVYCKSILVNGTIYPLPVRAVRFIERFDAGKPVKPIRFELPI